jgi:hypothetical protein
MPGTVENAHMSHPDFRFGKRIFATLDYPKPGHAMRKLTLDQRAMLIEAEPGMFAAVPGGWGKHGAAILHLDQAGEATADSAIRMAYSNLAGSLPASGPRVDYAMFSRRCGVIRGRDARFGAPGKSCPAPSAAWCTMALASSR